MDPLVPGTWVTDSGGGSQTWNVRRARLTVTDGPDASRTFDTEGETTRIGGSQVAQFRLSDPRVSGVHAEIAMTSSGFRLRDLDSRNGTFIGDVRVHDAYLHHGATIRVGSSKIRFEVLSDAMALPLSEGCEFGALVGQTPVMRALFARLQRIAETDVSTLIVGETGTGKDLTADAIHQASPRAGRRLVVIDCASIPANLIESELFGHQRGAFTGAVTDHAGAFERADDGTVFLDEIGELPLEMQPKLLRVLERRQVQRLGASHPIDVDVRILAATHRDLPREVARGRFREDLYYRLAVATVQVPPLRERLDDIPLLVDRIASRLAPDAGAHLAPETLELLKRHDWPGNVRELRNVLERVVYLDETPAGVTELGQGAPARATPPAPAPALANIELPFKQAKSELLRAFEQDYVGKLLERHGGNVSAVARVAGVDRTVVYKIIERHRLKKEP